MQAETWKIDWIFDQKVVRVVNVKSLIMQSNGQQFKLVAVEKNLHGFSASMWLQLERVSSCLTIMLTN